MQDYKIIIHLNNGSIIKTNKIDYYNQGRLFGCTDENGQRALCGTKFIKEIDYI